MRYAYLMLQAQPVKYRLASGQISDCHGLHSQSLCIPFQPIGEPLAIAFNRHVYPLRLAALGIRREPYIVSSAPITCVATEARSLMPRRQPLEPPANYSS